MGNWMTVNIVGECPQSELPNLRLIVSDNMNYKNFHCLVNTGGMAGIGDWAATKIKATGNLAERDYDVQSVADQLEIIGAACPTADIKIHCGGDYESKECVATVHLKNGKVETLAPEIETLEEIGDDLLRERLMGAMSGRK